MSQTRIAIRSNEVTARAHGCAEASRSSASVFRVFYVEYSIHNCVVMYDTCFVIHGETKMKVIEDRNLFCSCCNLQGRRRARQVVGRRQLSCGLAERNYLVMASRAPFPSKLDGLVTHNLLHRLRRESRPLAVSSPFKNCRCTFGVDLMIYKHVSSGPLMRP